MDSKQLKKTRDCGFINVVDPYVRNDIMSLTGCPNDATNFIFWFAKANPTEWGLTIKSVPKKDDDSSTKGSFTSQHTWKITWICKDNMLGIAGHCKSLGSDITGDQYDKIINIYKNYKR